MEPSADAGMREERKVVTALFVDIVGSTAIGERMDPEDVKLVIGDAVARAIGAVESFGGTIKDLAGDGVLALFGRIGVRALDDRTLEFNLAAPASYFMSVMNRPDGGPQPRHAIEAAGDAWTETGTQVVSGPFRVVERAADALVLERRPDYAGSRPGNASRIEFVWSTVPDAVAPYGRDELDMVTVRYTPRIADLVPALYDDANLGQATWSGYLAFDHRQPVTSSLDLRKALAHAIDRSELERHVPANMVIATGGVVPPALQGHTPDIAPRFDPDLAREHFARSGSSGVLGVGGLEEWEMVLEPVVEMWRDVLGIDVEVRGWTVQQAGTLATPWEIAPIVVTGWFPGYADPEYYLRLLFQSDSKTNGGGFSHPPFDELIERARQERSDRSRLELFHEADRMVVSEQIACIPLVYGRSMAFVKPWLRGWWEFGKSSANFADLTVGPDSPRA